MSGLACNTAIHMIKWRVFKQTGEEIRLIIPLGRVMKSKERKCPKVSNHSEQTTLCKLVFTYLTHTQVKSSEK